MTMDLCPRPLDNLKPPQSQCRKYRGALKIGLDLDHHLLSGRIKQVGRAADHNLEFLSFPLADQEKSKQMAMTWYAGGHSLQLTDIRYGSLQHSSWTPGWIRTVSEEGHILYT
jgi:hypothetical protein